MSMAETDILLRAIEYNGGGINTLLNKSIVKSVQRGRKELSLGKNTVTISAVDLDKAVLIANVTGVTSYYGYPIAASVTLNADSIVIEVSNKPDSNGLRSAWASWQVVEFY